MNLESLTFFVIGLAFGIILGIVGYCYLISLRESKRKWTPIVTMFYQNSYLDKNRNKKKKKNDYYYWYYN